MKKLTIAAMASLLAGVLNSSAAVTAQGWYHFGELQDYYGDSSGNGRRFQYAFSTGPNGTGNANAVVTSTGVGGPLDGTGYVSTKCLRFGDNGARQAAMWSPGTGGATYNPPATNYGLELWALPEGKGFVGGSGSWLLNSGQSAGSLVIRIQSNGDGTSSYFGTVNGKGDVGEPVVADTTKWTHLAIVNDNGTVTFYVDGVKKGASYSEKITNAITGDIYVGHPGANAGALGLLDEVRIFTFEPGKFATSDLLLPPPGPNIVSQPQNATVWEGGSAPFKISTVIDPTVTFQWSRNGQAIAGATESWYYLPLVTLADSNSLFSCKLVNTSGSVTSTVATLSVVPVKTDDVAAYRAAITKESSLVAYFPVDQCSGTVLTNLVSGGPNASLEGNATFDGRTTTAYGQRALSLNEDGDAAIPATAAFDFNSGNGTVEALVYLSRATLNPATIFAVAADGGSLVRYVLQASKDGASLICSNDLATLTWAVPTNLIGRLAYVAFVFESKTNVTAYLDGQSLGAKTQPDLGTSPGQAAWIGSMGSSAPGIWAGTIDELAIYSSALSLNTIQTHYSKYVYGVNIARPSFVSQSSSRTWFAGGSPTLAVTVDGSLPFNYQWSSNGVAIAGATGASLKLANTTTNFSAAYTVKVSNAAGETNSQPIVLKFVSAPDDYAQTVMKDNPISYWRLDEATGATVAADSAGANDGAYKNSLALGASSVITQITNAAVDFTGGYVEVPYTPALNPNGPFSLEFWSKLTRYDPNADTFCPVSSQGRLGSARYGWCVYLNNDGSGYEMHMGDATGVAGATRVSGATAGASGAMYHVVFAYNGTNLQVFVNGKLDFETTSGFPYTANYSAPLIIGGRNDLNFFEKGPMDEVAVYGYALSASQVQKHYGFSFVKSQVTQQPVNVSDAVETGTVTLTAAVAGYPNTYQWFKDGALLEPVNNADGTAHYPQGVTGTTLVIAQATPADAGRYHLVATNPLGNSTTADATVAVAADTTAPKVAYVGAQSTANRVRVVFNKPMTTDTTGLPGNYKFSDGVTVSSVALTADPSVVDVVTSGFQPGKSYTLTVSGVKDARMSQNLIGASSTSFKSYVLTTGALAFDFYAKIGGTAVETLVSDAQYPDGVYTNAMLASFSTMAITTGGDLNNNPAFGALGDNYGVHIYGWIKPATSGDYTFFLRSDDASQLWLSTDDQPANSAMIAEERGCCNPFKEPADGVTQTSPTQTLVAGKSYFIEAFYKEGGGGDFLEAAWRMAGDTTPAADLKPIAGQFLSAFAPVPAAKFDVPVLAAGQITLTWTGTGKLQESTDLANWSDVAGNPGSGYKVTPTASGLKFYRLAE